MDMLREVQLKELEILQEIKRICEKNNITYFLSCGTLLGAVRHQGFIPWDDDVDICMPYEDYVRFLEACESQLNERFVLQNCYTEPNDHKAFSKIRMNQTAFLPPHYTKYHIHHGLPVDIFPLTGAPGNSFVQKIKRKLFSLSNYILDDNYLRSTYDKYSKEFGKGKMKLLFLFYRIPIRLRRHFYDFCLKRFLKPCAGRKNVAEIWWNMDFYPARIFESSVPMLFEGENFPAPAGYKEYLTIQYGDYMQPPPPEKRQGHGEMIIDLENDYKIYLE